MGFIVQLILSTISIIPISTGKMCIDLMNYISDTVNISYSLIDAVCFISSQASIEYISSGDDSSGDNSGSDIMTTQTTTIIPVSTTSLTNICDFNCTDYTLHCKSLANNIYNIIYYINEKVKWEPAQFEKVCLDWPGPNTTTEPIIITNTTPEPVATGVLVTFGLICAGIVLTIVKICSTKPG